MHGAGGGAGSRVEDGGPASGDGQDAATRSLLGDLRTLVDDGRLALQAELAFQRSRLAYCGKAARNLAIFAIAGLLFSFFTLVALTVGVLIALIPEVSAWGATGIVTGVLLVALIICLWGALRSWRKIMAAMRGPER